MTSFKYANFIAFNFMDNEVQQHSEEAKYFGSVYLGTVSRDSKFVLFQV
jgi:hypothetical protein